MNSINKFATKQKVPTETGKDVEIIYSDSGEIKVKLKSPLIERYHTDSAYVVFPKGVWVEFYGEDRRVKTKLTADYGIKYENLGKMEAKKNVVLVNEKGERLNTEHLIWDERQQLIYTETFVKITTSEQVIYGDGLESNQDFSKYKIKNIKGFFTVNEENKTDDGTTKNN